MHDFLGEGLKSGGVEGVDGELHVFEDCSLDGDVGDGVVGFVDVGRVEFGGISALFYAIHPDLDVRVFVGQNFVGVVVRDGLEA